MTREQLKQKLIFLMEENIEVYCHDDSGLYLISPSLEDTAEKIITELGRDMS